MMIKGSVPVPQMLRNPTQQEQANDHRGDYLHMESHIFAGYSGVKNYTGDALEDGRLLGLDCLKQIKKLNDPGQFPPRLLILLASPAYLELPRARNLLDGIHESFEDAGHKNVPLIGCSTAGVFFKQQVHREGALLFCLASRLLEARVAVGANAADEPEKAVDDLLAGLQAYLRERKDPAPAPTPTIVSFLPGFIGDRYPAPKLHQRLRSKLPAGTPMFGGVASADDPLRDKPGILFAGKEVLHNAIVAARLIAKVPIGLGLEHGLTDTQRLLRVKDLSVDRKTIYSFEEGSAAEIMAIEEKKSPVVMFSELCTNCDPTVHDPVLIEDGTALRLAREVSEDCCFRVMSVQANKIHGATRKTIAQTRKRTENSIGCLLLICNGLLRHRQKIGLDFESMFREIKGDLSNGKTLHDCVGAFVDGEIGTDKHGKSLLGNWSTAAMVVGDALDNHAVVHDSFQQLAELAKHPLSSPKESIRQVLQLIYDIGYRGAMISFWMPDQQEEMIIAKDAVGACFERIVEETRRSISSRDILAIVAKEKSPRYVPDSRQPDSYCDQATVDKSGLISQYVIPLTNRDKKVNALLQIDLGDASYKEDLQPHEKEMLEAIGSIVISILNRVFSGEESRLTLALDEALKKSLSADTVNEGLRKFLELTLRSFGLKGGYIRLAHEEKQSLDLVVGAGEFYAAVKSLRSETAFGDASPLAQAFRKGEANIVNDAAHNKDHEWTRNRMLADGKSDRKTAEILDAIRAYAIIPFENESGQRGTINLLTSEPWFFAWHHKKAIEALGERVGFLLDTLKRRHSERFLLSAIPRLSQIQNLDDPSRVLANVTERFARSLTAEYASLFLWDEEQEIHILRAQYGWHDPAWVNGAKYKKNETWAGSTILAGSPQHIPNLLKFYDEHNYQNRGRYNEFIYGRSLSKEFTVEAIGLPLRLPTETIGVMMLYRQIQEGDPSGFLTTDKTLLIAGAAALTGHVKLVQTNNLERWEKEEFRRHQEVYEACAKLDDSLSFEATACQQILKSYRAIGIDFFATEDRGSSFLWQGGYERDSRTEKITPRKKETDGIQDSEDKAAFAKLARFQEPIKWPMRLAEEKLKNPRKAAIDGLIERVLVPLVADNHIVGLFDVRWKISGRQNHLNTYRHSNLHWELLGEKIGAVYRQHQLAQEQKRAKEMLAEAERMQRQAEERKRELDEQSGLAVKATGAYVFQSLHRLANVIQNLKSLPIIIENTQDDVERKEAIQALKEEMKKAFSTVESVKDIGERVVNPRRDACGLLRLIRQAVEETGATKTANVILDETSLDITVEVDPDHTRQVFLNLINNAVKAMEGRQKRELKVSANSSRTDEITISFKDTGKGMTDEEIQKALRGFVKTEDHKGVGVLISSVLLNAQRGSLSYRQNEDEGIEAIVTLKISHKEA
ncbi:MAG: GAF domain-containing protein [Blastocatellia bacterium]|nr:GAF domain-containing protein [Blastocatellia bacterium]